MIQISVQTNCLKTLKKIKLMIFHYQQKIELMIIFLKIECNPFYSHLLKKRVQFAKKKFRCLNCEKKKYNVELKPAQNIEDSQQS